MEMSRNFETDFPIFAATNILNVYFPIVRDFVVLLIFFNNARNKMLFDLSIMLKQVAN
jgi:hypothetical protein